MRPEPGIPQIRLLPPVLKPPARQAASIGLRFAAASQMPEEEAARQTAAVAKFQLLQAQADEKRKSLPCLLQARFPLKGKKATPKEMQDIQAASGMAFPSRQQEKALLSHINLLLLGLEGHNSLEPLITGRMSEPLAQEIFKSHCYRRKTNQLVDDLIRLAVELPHDSQKVEILRHLMDIPGMTPLYYFLLAATFKDISAQVAMIRELVDCPTFPQKRHLHYALEAIPDETIRTAEIERCLAYENTALEVRTQMMNGDDEVRDEAVKAIASLSDAHEDKKITLIRAALNREDDWFLAESIATAIASLSRQENRESLIRECLDAKCQMIKKTGFLACRAIAQNTISRDDTHPRRDIAPALLIRILLEDETHCFDSNDVTLADVGMVRYLAETETGKQFIQALCTTPQAYPDLSERKRKMIIAMALPKIDNPQLVTQVLPGLLEEEEHPFPYLLDEALPKFPDTFPGKANLIRTRLKSDERYSIRTNAYAEALASLPHEERLQLLSDLIPQEADTPIAESFLIINLQQATAALSDQEKYKFLNRYLSEKRITDPQTLEDFIPEFQDPALREALLKKMEAHPQGEIRNAVTAIRLRLLLKKADQTGAEAMIRTLWHTQDEEVRSLATRSICELTDPERRFALGRELLSASNPSTRKYAISVMTESLWSRLSQTLSETGYMQSVKQIFPETLADPNRKDPNLSVLDLLRLLAMMSILDQDAGDIPKTLLPQYEDLLAYAKAEANNHRGVGEGEYSPESIENGFKTNQTVLLRGITLFGPDVFKFKLNQGMERFIKFLETLPHFFAEEPVMQALHRLAALPNTQPHDTAKLVEIAAGFMLMGQSEELVRQLAMQQCLNIRALGKAYLETFARVFGLKCEVSDQSFEKWNLEYMNALSEAYRNFDPDAQQALKALVAATLADTYPAYLVNPDTEVGKANAQTAETFQLNGLNHQTWLHYDQTRAFTVDKEEQANFETIFQQYRSHLSGDILALTGSWREQRPGLLEKQDTQALFGMLKHQGYRFENNLLTSDTPEKLTAPALGALSAQVEGFLEKRGIVANAKQQDRQDILTLVSHISQRVQDFDTLKKQVPAGVKNLALKIWDRNPGYDLFQGNYSQCCIAVDRHNRSAIVDYLSTTLSQMVEVKDSDTGRTIANAVLFWAKNEDAEDATKNSPPMLVVDSVEIATQYAGASEKIKQEMIPYLKDYAKAVSGKDSPLLVGTRYNDINLEGLAEHPMDNCQVLGTSPTEEFYLDALAGNEWTNITEPVSTDFRVLSP